MSKTPRRSQIELQSTPQRARRSSSSKRTPATLKQSSCQDSGNKENAQIATKKVQKLLVQKSVAVLEPSRLEPIDVLKDEPLNMKGSHIKNFKLQQLFRMHWRSDVNDDIDALQPEVWACKFAPRLPEEIAQSQSVHLVATCGAISVCITDCDANAVMMKYLHVDEPHEEFQCLAWSVVPFQSSHCRILAVAGKAKSVKLIDVAQKVCYRYIEGHRRAVNCMQFLKHRPFWLLSGSDDATVRLTDVGPVLVSTDEDATVQNATCLAIFDCKFAVIAMALEPFEIHFMASNEDCAIANFDLQTEYENLRELADSKKQPSAKIQPLMYYDGDGWPTSIVDFMAFVDHDKLVCKSYKGEVWVVRYSESSEEEAAIEARYDWKAAESAQMQGCLAGNTLLLGDDTGNVRVYDLTQSPAKKNGLGKLLSQLSHPESVQTIRDVDVSYDGHYIVACDCQDGVWIWSAVDT